MNAATSDSDAGPSWPAEIYDCFKEYDVKQVSYVPDAGHSRLIRMAHEDPAINTTVLTTEEEGIAISAGAWLGGQRAVLLMQSSGVGNCINMLSLMASWPFPLPDAGDDAGRVGGVQPVADADGAGDADRARRDGRHRDAGEPCRGGVRDGQCRGGFGV